ncbi:MAG: hypothetical protein WBC85_05830 [Planktotalea sp.]|uniref:hypothetical protein n=1 Tax=Planktotalea sp. TaxID=2029877 RepID=UPI003C780D69
MASLTSVLGLLALSSGSVSAATQADAHRSMIQHCIAAVGTGDKGAMREVDERGAKVLGVSYFIVPVGNALLCDVYAGDFPGQTDSTREEVSAFHAGLADWIHITKPMLDDETALTQPIYHVCHGKQGVSVNIPFDVNADTPQRINLAIVPETEGKTQC